MAAIPIEYTAYGHLREGDWIAHRSTANESFYNLRALTLRCTRILPVEDDAI